MSQLAAIDKAEADTAGLTVLLKEGEELGDRRDALVQELEQLRAQVQGREAELADLDGEQNAFYKEALDRFGRFLGQTRLALLEQRARRSDQPDDDSLVAQLAALDRQLDELKPRLTALSDHRRAAERVREGLDQVVRRYRQANFDSSRSYFNDSPDPRRSVEAFRSGEVDADALWSSLRSSQRFQPHWVETTTGSAAEVVTSPSGRVILGAVVDLANQAMRNAAFRGVQRRGEFPFPSPRPTSIPMPSPGPAAPAPSKGGFTTGEGF
jgi:hypothetical protein